MRDRKSEPPHFLAVMPPMKLVAGVYEPGHRKSLRKDAPFIPHTYDWREPPGSKSNTAGIRPEARVNLFLEVLMKHYDHDAFVVNYIVFDNDTGLPCRDSNGEYCQPRVNKDGLRWMKQQEYSVMTCTFLADCDTIGHKPWNPEERADIDAKIRACPLLKTALIYFTPKGFRVVQRLLIPIDVEDVEPILREWLAHLAKWGIQEDGRCHDWTHVMRAPNCLRDGTTRITGEFWNLENERPIDIEAMLDSLDPMPVVEIPGKPKMRRSERKRDLRQPGDQKRNRRSVGEIVFTDDIPVGWDTKASLIGGTVARQEQSGIRECYLGIFGTLLKKHTPPQFLPEIARRIAAAADSKDIEDKVKLALRTIDRWKAGKPIRGFTSLKATHLAVAEIVFQETMDGEDCRIVNQLSEGKDRVVEVFSPHEAKLKMENEYRYPVPRVVMIHADAGLGKSHAAWRVGVERMEAGMPAIGSTPMQLLSHKWPQNSRTIISVDKNELAIQLMNDVRTIGNADAIRLYGIASLKDETGKLVCIYPEQALALTAGKQSVGYNLCLGGAEEGSPKNCSEIGTCAAYRAMEVPVAPGSPLVLCTHTMIAKAEDVVGKGAVLIVDEPPSYLKTEMMTVEDIEFAMANDSFFSKAYKKAMRPLMTAVLAWARTIAVPVEGSETTDFYTAIEQAADAIDQDEIRAAMNVTHIDDAGDVSHNAIHCAMAAFDSIDENTGETKTAPSSAPPLLPTNMEKLRLHKTHAKEVGRASFVYKTIWDAASCPPDTADHKAPKAVVWVEERGDQRVLSLMQPQDHLVAALKRPEGCVISDANAELHIDIIEKIIGYKPKVLRLAAEDKRPVTRVLQKWATANKKGWFANGRVQSGVGIDKAFRKAIEFANEGRYKDPTFAQLTIITFKQVKMVLEWILGKQPTQTDVQWWNRKNELESEWKVIHKSMKSLTNLADELRPVLTEWKGSWIVGHYFGIRGMNHAKDTDVIITIGDPWMNRLAVAREADYLGLDAEERQEQFVRAELYQAQERARTAQRQKILRAMHIGMQVPSGHVWTSGVVSLRVSDDGGSRKETAATRVQLLKLVETSKFTKTEIAKEAGLARQHLDKLLLDEGNPNSRPITAPIWENLQASVSRLNEGSKT